MKGLGYDLSLFFLRKSAQNNSMRTLTGLLVISSLFVSCTIYRSPERKEFESQNPNFKVQNLKLNSCADKSVAARAAASRLVTIQDDVAMWEHVVDNTSKFESNNNKGEFCLYDYEQQ